MKKALLGLLLCCSVLARAQFVTLTGTVQSTNGLPASNFTISFTPSQWFFVADTGVMVNTTTFCATSVDGSVVGLPNPTQASVATPGYTGTLPASDYYIKYTFYTASTETLPSPETVAQLTSTGQLSVAAPTSGIPAGALGMRVYISTTTGTESLQGSTTGSGPFIQSIPLVTGAAFPSTNTTVCKQVANDAGWPTGTGYTVSLTDPSGNTIPGYPMMWQLLGPNTTINLSNGLPYYHGIVTFPVPILASPYNHNAQSISGPLSLTGYNLVNVGNLGLCTGLPAWAIDDECSTGVNSNPGYLVDGAAPNNHVLLGNGSYYVDSATIPASIISGLTLSYQTVQSNTTAQPQEPALNFSSRFAVTDSSGVRTTADLAASGVTAGSYTCPNATVDTYGRVTSISSGTCKQYEDLIITTGICTTTGSEGLNGACTMSAVNWPAAFADTNYTVNCTTFPPHSGGGNASIFVYITAKSASAVTLSLENGSNSAAVASTTSEIDCHGSHL